MLITRAFTFIHLPKTGGTFVTSILERLHGQPRTRSGRVIQRVERKLNLPLSPAHWRYGELNHVDPKHGTCRDIPAGDSGKPILSCIRGPHEWYVSQYEFAWWNRIFDYEERDRPTPAGAALEEALPGFAASHPHFPEIDFAEFMRLCDAAADLYNAQSGTDFGLFTHQFVRFFYRDAPKALRELDGEYLKSGRHIADRFNVSFLRTEELNTDLEAALRSFGYRRQDLRFIADAERVLPMGIGRDSSQHWEDYYSPELADFVRERDAPLFAMFPAFDRYMDRLRSRAV